MEVSGRGAGEISTAPCTQIVMENVMVLRRGVIEIKEFIVANLAGYFYTLP